MRYPLLKPSFLEYTSNGPWAIVRVNGEGTPVYVVCSGPSRTSDFGLKLFKELTHDV